MGELAEALVSQRIGPERGAASAGVQGGSSGGCRTHRIASGLLRSSFVQHPLSEEARHAAPPPAKGRNRIRTRNTPFLPKVSALAVFALAIPCKSAMDNLTFRAFPFPIVWNGKVMPF